MLELDELELLWLLLEETLLDDELKELLDDTELDDDRLLLDDNELDEDRLLLLLTDEELLLELWLELDSDETLLLLD